MKKTIRSSDAKKVIDYFSMAILSRRYDYILENLKIQFNFPTLADTLIVSSFDFFAWAHAAT